MYGVLEIMIGCFIVGLEVIGVLFIGCLTILVAQFISMKIFKFNLCKYVLYQLFKEVM